MWLTEYLVPEDISPIRLVLLPVQVIRSPRYLATPIACRDAHHKWRVSHSFQIRQERG